MCLCSPKNKKHNPQLSVLVKNNRIFVRLSSTVAHFYLSCFERPLLVKSELTHHHYHRSHCCQRFYQNLLFATIWANGETKNTNQQNSKVCEVITQARCVVGAAVVFSAAIIIPAAVSICMMTDIKHHAVHTAFIKITGSDQWRVGSGLTVFIEVPVNTLDVLVKL